MLLIKIPNINGIEVMPIVLDFPIVPNLFHVPPPKRNNLLHAFTERDLANVKIFQILSLLLMLKYITLPGTTVILILMGSI